MKRSIEEKNSNARGNAGMVYRLWKGTTSGGGRWTRLIFRNGRRAISRALTRIEPNRRWALDRDKINDRVSGRPANRHYSPNYVGSMETLVSTCRRQRHDWWTTRAQYVPSRDFLPIHLLSRATDIVWIPTREWKVVLLRKKKNLLHLPKYFRYQLFHLRV